MAKDKLVYCRACGSEIAHSAKKCPKCGAKQKKSHGFRNLLLLLIVACALYAGFGRNMFSRNAPQGNGTVQAALDMISDTRNEDTDSGVDTAEITPIEPPTVEAKEIPADSNDAPEAEIPAEEESIAPEEEAQTGLTPEFKSFMDSYEEFMNEYVEFMENYDQSDLTTLSKYASMTAKLADFDSKASAYNEDNLSAEDYKYYVDVNSRIQKRMADVAFS